MDSSTRLDEPTHARGGAVRGDVGRDPAAAARGPVRSGPGRSGRANCGCSCCCSPGMSFVGYIAQRMSGAAGYPLTGLLGGLVSSTSVTLTFARLSESHPQQAAPLAAGAVAASTVLFLRVAVAVAILECRAVAGAGALSCRAIGRRPRRGGAGVAIAARSQSRTGEIEEPTAAPERDRDGAAVSGGAVRGVLHARVGRRRRACSPADSCSASPTSMP